MKKLTAGSLPTFDISKADLQAITDWYNANSGSTVKQTFNTIEKAREKATELAAAITDLSAEDGSKKGKKNKSVAKLKVEAKKAAKNKGKKEAAPGKAGQGRASSFAGKTITRAIDKETKKAIANPRREGTFGFKSFNVIKDGMTYEDYIKAGGRANDLRWDVDKGYVIVK